jgi:hypothetical protein
MITMERGRLAQPLAEAAADDTRAIGIFATVRRGGGDSDQPRSHGHDVDAAPSPLSEKLMSYDGAAGRDIGGLPIKWIAWRVGGRCRCGYLAQSRQLSPAPPPAVKSGSFLHQDD